MKQELRLILTQACNYNCYFCHHEGINGEKKSLLDGDDLQFLYSVANENLGIKSVTLTGGEPLILKDIEEITEKLRVCGCYITIVTNGSLLDKRMNIGKYIDKLNISLHSLDEKEYESIVGRKNVLTKVVENIIEFRKMYPTVEINLNYALANASGIYEKVFPIITFAKENNLNIKFIEMFPKNSRNFISIEKLQDKLLENNHELMESGIIKTYFSNGENSHIYTTKCLCSRALDFDSPSNFCHLNNDLFISQDGVINLCRLKNDNIEILDELKARDDRNLSKKLKLAFSRLGEGCPYEKK